MSAISPEKQTALAWVDANQKRLSDFHLEIWRYAETAFREYKSARAYCDLLRKEGFQVEEGSADMPTAFLATFGEGRPVLGSYAEYDAVPENSQEPGLGEVPDRADVRGDHRREGAGSEWGRSPPGWESRPPRHCAPRRDGLPRMTLRHPDLA